jgi:general stress protein YciG
MEGGFTMPSKGQGRGFASMSPEKKREIASKGGKAAHAQGTAHKWTSEEAQAAGRKGGSISRRRPRSTAKA